MSHWEMWRSEKVLLTIMTVEGIVVFIALLYYILHGVWIALYRRRRARLLAAGRSLILPILDPAYPEMDAERVGQLSRLPVALQVSLLAELAGNFAATHRRRLADIAFAAGLIRVASRDIQSRYWWRRLRGARLLTLLGISDPGMLGLFGDRNLEVRAQAAEWGAIHPTPQVIQALLGLLGDPVGLCRFTVQDALLRIGVPVVEPMVEYLRSPLPARAMESALRVAIGIAHVDFLKAAMSVVARSEPGVRALGARLLGRLGGGDAIVVLMQLLLDPDGEVRGHAVSSLGSLQARSHVREIGVMLRDRHWRVRREAGFALRNLGAPGILLLRHYRGDRDSFASDMARQVLDLPDVYRGVSA